MWMPVWAEMVKLMSFNKPQTCKMGNNSTVGMRLLEKSSSTVVPKELYLVRFGLRHLITDKNVLPVEVRSALKTVPMSDAELAQIPLGSPLTSFEKLVKKESFSYTRTQTNATMAGNH
jgi:hypothetical protein